MHGFSMGNRPAVEEHGHAVDSTERFVLIQNFLSYGFGIAYEQRSFGAAGGVILGTRDGRPAALFPDLIEDARVGGVELVGSLLGSVGQVADRVNSDREILDAMSGAAARLTIKIY